jgi:acyl-CoA synthetase (AMP-forming)/AMP-acid ligase II
MNVGDLVTRSARWYGDRTAIIDGDRHVSFRQLDERSDRLATALLAQGMAPGDRVAVFVANRLEWFDVTFALLKAGLVRTYINPRAAPAEITDQLLDAEPVAVIVSEEHRSALDAADLGTIANVIETGPGYERLLRDADGDRPGVPVDEVDLAAIMYSSGTTGRPKGAMQTHGNWLAHTRAGLCDLGPTADDVLLHVGPLGHASGGFAYLLLARGGTQVISRAFDPAALLDAVVEHGVTTLLLVPTMIYMLLDVIEQRAADTRTLRTLLYGASPMAPDRIERCLRILGPILVQCYGMTEAVGGLTFLAKADHVEGNARLASAGRPSLIGDLRVIDDDGQALPAGTVGQIAVRGAHVMSGYWRRPAETAEVLDADGWYRTHDMGYFDDADYLFLVDRKTDMVVSGGFNVFPAEVEHALMAHAAVAEAAVIAVPDEKWGEAVKAVVRLRPGAAATSAELATWCRARVAPYKVPKSYDFTVDDLPKTSTGKLQRRLIRDPYWTGRSRNVG